MAISPHASFTNRHLPKWWRNAMPIFFNESCPVLIAQSRRTMEPRDVLLGVSFNEKSMTVYANSVCYGSLQLDDFAQWLFSRRSLFFAAIVNGFGTSARVALKFTPIPMEIEQQDRVNLLLTCSICLLPITQAVSLCAWCGVSFCRRHGGTCNHCPMTGCGCCIAGHVCSEHFDP